MKHLTNLIENYFGKEQTLLVESTNRDLINFKVNFVLSEAKKAVTKKTGDAPWGKEKWLETNPKIQKNSLVRDKVNGKTVVYHSFIINLLPANESGVNVCACATSDCARTCLHQSGNIGMLVGKTQARFRKTWYLYLQTDDAVKEIVNAVTREKRKIDNRNASNEPYMDFQYDEEGDKIVDGYKTVIRKNKKTGVMENKQRPIYKKVPVDNPYHVLVIRMNGTSDLNWLAHKVEGGRNIFEMFPDVVFYDYTKMKPVAQKFLDQELPPNYHVTFSYGGKENKDEALQILNKGGNLAVAFAPGKTNSMENSKFPATMSDLLHNFKYPLDSTGDAMSPAEQRDYENKIIETWREKGCYVDDGELSKFAGETLLPGLFDCHEVIDGDNYDGRFLDDYYHQGEPNSDFRNFQKLSQNKPGLVVGLTAKGPLAYDLYDESGWNIELKDKFVVGPNDDFLNNQVCSEKDYNYKKPLADLQSKTEVYRKICHAIFIVRNMDARNASKEFATDGTFDARKLKQKEIGSKPTVINAPPKDEQKLHSYDATKKRFNQEMDNVRFIFRYVLEPETRTSQDTARINMMMKSKDPLKKDDESKKFTDVKLFAEKFNKYLDSLIKQGKLNLVTKKSLAMLMNPTTLFKAMKDKDLQTMIPLGIAASLSTYQACRTAYGTDTSKWHKIARIAAGVDKTDDIELKEKANKFALNIRSERNGGLGEKWWEWKPKEKEESGILETDAPAPTTAGFKEWFNRF